MGWADVWYRKEAGANPYANPVAELRRGRPVLIDTYFAQERAQDGAGFSACDVNIPSEVK